MELGDMLTRIRDVYGLDVAELPNGNLLEICRRLHERRADNRSGSQWRRRANVLNKS
jgi:hypothetical protein